MKAALNDVYSSCEETFLYSAGLRTVQMLVKSTNCCMLTDQRLWSFVDWSQQNWSAAQIILTYRAQMATCRDCASACACAFHVQIAHNLIDFFWIAQACITGVHECLKAFDCLSLCWLLTNCISTAYSKYAVAYLCQCQSRRHIWGRHCHAGG